MLVTTARIQATYRASYVSDIITFYFEFFIVVFAQNVKIAPGITTRCGKGEYALQEEKLTKTKGHEPK